MVNKHDFKFLSREVVFQDWFKLVQESFVLPNGKSMTFTFIEQKDGIIVLPLTSNREIVMIEQYRAPLGKVNLELVAGLCEPGEKPSEAALRELKEETGYKAGKIVHLTTIYPSVGMMNFKSHLFFATELQKGRQHLDEMEVIDTRLVPLEDFKKIVLAGMNEGGMFLAYLLAKEKGLI